MNKTGLTLKITFMEVNERLASVLPWELAGTLACFSVRDHYSSHFVIFNGPGKGCGERKK